MGNKGKPKTSKGGTKGNAKKERKKQQQQALMRKGRPDLAENDDQERFTQPIQASLHPPDSMPQRNSRIARVQMDGSIAHSEDDDEEQDNKPITQQQQQQQQDSPTKSPSNTKENKTQKERIVIEDPNLAKKIAKFIAKQERKKERKRKRRELFRRGPLIKRTYSSDSLGDMSRSTIENLYGTVSVTGTTSRNLSPSTADPSVHVASKSPGVGSIELDSDDDNGEESDGYLSTASSSENDDLLLAAVVALENYQKTYLSGQSDMDDCKTDGSKDNDDPSAHSVEVDDTPVNPADTVETRTSISRKSGLQKAPHKGKKTDKDFIIKHIKKQTSKQHLVGKRKSTAIDVDGYKAGDTTVDFLNWVPPEQIEIKQKEQDCVSVDISFDLDLDLEDEADQDEEHGTKEHEAKQHQGKGVEPPESPSKRKKPNNVTVKGRHHDTPVQDYVHGSVNMESQVVNDISGRKSSNGRRRLVLCGLMALIMGGLTGLIIWILSRKGIIDVSNDQDIATTTPPVQLSTVTSPIYTLVSNAVQTDFGNATMSRLQDPLSPQARAAIWLATDDTFLSFPLAADDVDSRKIFRQRYAMATLYYATDGKSWRNQFGFLSPSHICDWTTGDGSIGGVFCLGETVLGITLATNQLDGSIPDEIWALEDLQLLELDENSIDGSLPEGISRLSRLQTLSLPGNPLSGTLPTSLGLLSNLTRLSVSNCELTGQLPDELANTGLETLLLDGNRFEGTVPTAYSRLPLKHFTIQRNMISGDLTSSICAIGTLESATADCNVLCGCCEECA